MLRISIKAMYSGSPQRQFGNGAESPHPRVVSGNADGGGGRGSNAIDSAERPRGNADGAAPLANGSTRRTFNGRDSDGSGGGCRAGQGANGSSTSGSQRCLRGGAFGGNPTPFDTNAGIIGGGLKAALGLCVSKAGCRLNGTSK